MIPPSQRLKYKQIFNTHDLTHKGFLTGMCQCLAFYRVDGKSRFPRCNVIKKTNLCSYTKLLDSNSRVLTPPGKSIKVLDF